MSSSLRATLWCYCGRRLPAARSARDRPRPCRFLAPCGIVCGGGCRGAELGGCRPPASRQGRAPRPDPPVLAGWDGARSQVRPDPASSRYGQKVAELLRSETYSPVVPEGNKMGGAARRGRRSRQNVLLAVAASPPQEALSKDSAVRHRNHRTGRWTSLALNPGRATAGKPQTSSPAAPVHVCAFPPALVTPPGA